MIKQHITGQNHYETNIKLGPNVSKKTQDQSDKTHLTTKNLKVSCQSNS